MGVIVKNNVGYSEYNGNGRMFLSNGIATYAGDDGAPYKKPQDVTTDFSTSTWSNWGEDNLLPYEMANHIENCGVLNAAMDAKARIAMGKGIAPFLLMSVTPDGKEDLQYCDNKVILDWLELNNLLDFGIDYCYDEYSYGWSLGSFMLNETREVINRVRRIDVHTARLAKLEQNVDIKKVFLSNAWDKLGNSSDKSKFVELPVLKEGHELEDLKSKKAGFEFAFLNRKKRDGRLYYPLPLWWSAKDWVKIARSIPKFKNAMFANQISIKYIINISSKYWEETYKTDWQNFTPAEREKKQEEKYNEIDAWLVGEEKAYKSITSGTYYDDISGKDLPLITITVLDDKIKDGKLLPDSSAANSEILFAAMVQPSFIGAGQPGGPYSNNAGGSNVRESHLSQMMITEYERRHVTNILNIVKQYNGWDKLVETQIDYTQPNGQVIKKTPRLVFRNLSGLLTTLDTGKSTKAETL